MLLIIAIIVSFIPFFGVYLWLRNGLYDFSLSDEFLAINENIVIVPFLLAFADIVLAVILIVFTRKARKREKYTTRDILA